VVFDGDPFSSVSGRGHAASGGDRTLVLILPGQRLQRRGWRVHGSASRSCERTVRRTQLSVPGRSRSLSGKLKATITRWRPHPETVNGEPEPSQWPVGGEKSSLEDRSEEDSSNNF